MYESFRRLKPHQRTTLKQIIIMFSVITAALTVLIIITGSDFLYTLLSIERMKGISAAPVDYISARVTLPGLWTIMPFGFWFCMHELVRGRRPSKKRVLVFGFGAGIMATALLMNFSRNLLLGFVTGFLFALILISFLMDFQVKNRMLILSAFLISVFFLILLQSSDVLDIWSTRFQEGLGGSSIEGRVDRNLYMLDLLLDRFPIMGSEELVTYSLVHGPRADQHTMMTVWSRFGSVGLAAFLGIILMILLKLVHIIRHKAMYHPESILAAVFMLANYIQFHGSMVSGDLLRGDTVFVLIFFISEIEFYASRRHPRFWKQPEPVPVMQPA